jgi:hypothetical protein
MRRDTVGVEEEVEGGIDQRVRLSRSSAAEAAEETAEIYINRIIEGEDVRSGSAS